MLRPDLRRLEVQARILCGQPPPRSVPAREQGARNIALQVEIRLTYDSPALLIAQILLARRSSRQYRLRDLVERSVNRVTCDFRQKLNLAIK